MEKKLVTAEVLAAIADLPPFDVLRAQFLSLLTSNAASFVRLLDAKVKKDQPAA
jgi:large subunit ribosomal protein L10